MRRSVLLRLAAIGGLMLAPIAGLAAQARQKQGGVAETLIAVDVQLCVLRRKMPE